MTDTTEAKRFANWFRQNYPGPDTVIGRPDWHAPKIYRAATHELQKQLDALAAERDALRDAARAAHSALCEQLGDTDVDHYETEGEMRDDDPVQWAAMTLARATFGKAKP